MAATGARGSARAAGSPGVGAWRQQNVTRGVSGFWSPGGCVGNEVKATARDGVGPVNKPRLLRDGSDWKRPMPHHSEGVTNPIYLSI